MFSSVKPILFDAINRFGRSQFGSKNRCKALLYDLTGNRHTFEIDKLLTLYDAGLINDFIEYDGSISLCDFLTNQTGSLQQNTKLEGNDSTMVVATWASVFKLGPEDEIKSWIERQISNKKRSAFPTVISALNSDSPLSFHVSDLQKKYMSFVLFFIKSFLFFFPWFVILWIINVGFNYLIGWFFWGWLGLGMKFFALFISYGVLVIRYEDIEKSSTINQSIVVEKSNMHVYFWFLSMMLTFLIFSKFDNFYSWFILSIYFAIIEAITRVFFHSASNLIDPPDIV